ncbi:hypothetical protein ACFQ0G_30100 [Streptomyces chiangmaiensis]
MPALPFGLLKSSVWSVLRKEKLTPIAASVPTKTHQSRLLCVTRAARSGATHARKPMLSRATATKNTRSTTRTAVGGAAVAAAGGRGRAWLLLGAW